MCTTARVKKDDILDLRDTVVQAINLQDKHFFFIQDIFNK